MQASTQITADTGFRGRVAVLIGSTVVDILENSPLFSGMVEASKETRVGDIWDGAVFTTPAPPPPSAAEIQAVIVAATQQRLDDFARTRNYDGILSAATYASSTVPRFADEGQAAVNARDATWATLYTLLGEVQAGTRPMPAGFADIEAELPALEWPV